MYAKTLNQINKLLIESGGSGQRWTYRDRRHSPASIGKQTKLEDVVDVKRTINLPKLPDALPRFDVVATLELTMKDGSKKTYEKTITIDTEKKDDVDAGKIYFSWLGSVFFNLKTITTHAVKMDWGDNSSLEK